jgi:hypothetical protein
MILESVARQCIFFVINFRISCPIPFFCENILQAGFTGIGVGAAYYGLRPIVEFMTFNFYRLESFSFKTTPNVLSRFYQNDSNLELIRYMLSCFQMPDKIIIISNISLTIIEQATGKHANAKVVARIIIIINYVTLHS